uniref:HDC03523 n=1 Tax=Drosophila melanogaster TaxID=7227 RepID=Q6IH27_DROME|nr:TPA_inf: HDC03523 [Drosophila melanogaster]
MQRHGFISGLLAADRRLVFIFAFVFRIFCFWFLSAIPIYNETTHAACGGVRGAILPTKTRNRGPKTGPGDLRWTGQAGDAARCGAVRSDGNDGKRLFCVHCIFEIQNCMMARAAGPMVPGLQASSFKSLVSGPWSLFPRSLDLLWRRAFG